ncbi:MAG TPA: MFS transporter, partial [Actinomycetales bacterium]|nr:MFS transporter [Actinomycetales bacterium]
PSVGWWMALPLFIAGVGSGLVISPNQTLTLVEVPVERGGSAGGVLQTGQRMGTSLGIAIVGALYFAGSHSDPITAVANGLWATIVLTAVSLIVGIFDLVWRKTAP